MGHALSGVADVKRKIVGFAQDEFGDWTAELECGHCQHVRHNPPWMNRPWVTTPEGRAGFVGHELICVDCRDSLSDSASG